VTAPAIAAMVLAALPALAGGSAAAVPTEAPPPRRNAVDSEVAAALRAHRERDLGAALAAMPPGDAAARLELAESLADLLPADGGEGTASATPLRRLVAELCLEAMRLDERQWARALGLLVAIEPNPQQRREWARWRGTAVIRSTGDAASASREGALQRGDPPWVDPLRIGRAIDRLSAGEALPAESSEAVLLRRWLAAHPRAWPGFAAGAPGEAPRIDAPEAGVALRLLEAEWAWLDPDGAGFAGSLLIGGDRPLPEVDIETLERRVRAVYCVPGEANGPP